MSENVTRQNSMPPVPSTGNPVMDSFLRAVFENINILLGAQGDPMDGAARYRDLTRLGVAKEDATAAASATASNTIPENLLPVYVPLTSDQLKRPPVAGDPVAVGGFAQIIISWASPKFEWLGSTEVWRSNDSNLSHAVLIGTAAGTIYVDKMGGDESLKYYWIRHISKYKSEGAPDGAFNENPASAQIAVDVPHLISILSGSYRSAHPDVPEADVPLLFIVRPVITVGAEEGEMVDMGDGTPVFVPSGVYITRAAIARATITTAQIKELSADKITTGTIGVGETITVGGSIQAGKNAYSDVSPGWWIGDDGGTYKLIIGDSTHFMRWNGLKLEVRGDTALFDNISGHNTHFDNSDIDLGHSSLMYAENMVITQHQAGMLLMVSDYASSMYFDNPLKDGYLCLAGKIRNDMQMVMGVGVTTSSLLTPDFKAYDEADNTTQRRARKQRLTLRVFSMSFQGTIGIYDQYGALRFSCYVFTDTDAAYNNNLERVTARTASLAAVDPQATLMAIGMAMAFSGSLPVSDLGVSIPSPIGTLNLSGGGSTTIYPSIRAIPSSHTTPAVGSSLGTAEAYFGGYLFTYVDGIEYNAGDSFYMKTSPRSGYGATSGAAGFSIVADNGMPFIDEDINNGVPFTT